jgi:hypothetical protein
MAFDASVYSVLCEFAYGEDEGEVTYTLYLTFDNKLHKLKFTAVGTYPNNKVIWLLLNKALIDNGSKDRLIANGNHFNNLVLAQPEKYNELLMKLK